MPWLDEERPQWGVSSLCHDLATMPWEGHGDDPSHLSLLLTLLPHQQLCWCVIVFNTYDTLVTLALRLALEAWFLKKKSIDYWSNKNYDATKWVTLRGDWSLTMLGKRHLNVNGPRKLPATNGSACSDQTQGPQTCHTPFMLVERNEKQK